MEIPDLENALRLIREFNPLERVLLTTTGTLQGALSAYFGTPIEVRVTAQSEPAPGRLLREVRLVCPENGLEACRATTEITVEREDVKRLILEGRHGLGRILAVCGLSPLFNLEEIGRQETTFWRRYRLEAPGVLYRIREEFPQSLYSLAALTHPPQTSS